MKSSQKSMFLFYFLERFGKKGENVDEIDPILFKISIAGLNNFIAMFYFIVVSNIFLINLFVY